VAEEAGKGQAIPENLAKVTDRVPEMGSRKPSKTTLAASCLRMTVILLSSYQLDHPNSLFNLSPKCLSSTRISVLMLFSTNPP
jgi:hypothetical protein